MRLTDEQTGLIHQTAEQMFGPGARVYLFGSRTDDTQRGGDIDLFIETDEPLQNRASAAARFAAKLQLRMGDRRIDVLIVDPQTERQPIHQTAKDNGIRL